MNDLEPSIGVIAPIYMPSTDSTFTPNADQLAVQIDGAAADVYNIANRFSDEYKAREAAALAYQTAAYKGTPSPYVATFATAAGLSNKDAAELIISQSVAYRAALEALGALRMQKFAVRTLAATDIDAAQTLTHDTLTQIRAIGAQL